MATSNAPPIFNIEKYQEAGSMWIWPSGSLPARELFAGQGPSEGLGIIRGIQCWAWSDESSESVLEVKVLEQGGIPDWLAQRVPEKNDKKPCAGLKILQMNQQTAQLPISSTDYQSILEEFGLPPVELHLASRSQGGVAMTEEIDGSHVLVQRKNHIRGMTSVVVRYDPRTNFTRGYLITTLHPDRDTNYLNNIPRQFLGCRHPFLLPIAMAEADFNHIMPFTVSLFGRLREIERRTGFTNNEGDDELARNVNYQVLIRALGELHMYHSDIQTIWYSFQLLVKYLQRELAIIEESAGKFNHNLKRSSSVLRTRMQFFSSTLEHAAIFGNFQRRLDAQQDALFNLIAQVDTQINIELAKDSKELATASKEDSSAMKIIAILTTLFLPGAFVATFFAMPFFNWQEPRFSHIATSHFWIYWAVTGPLTAFIGAGVASWAVWHRQRTRLLIQKARDSIAKSSSSPVGPDESQRVSRTPLFSLKFSGRPVGLRNIKRRYTNSA